MRGLFLDLDWLVCALFCVSGVCCLVVAAAAAVATCAAEGRVTKSSFSTTAGVVLLPLTSTL